MTSTTSDHEDITPAVIRAVRAYLGWPAYALAEKVQVTRMTLSNIELGKTPVTPYAEKLHEVFAQAGVVTTRRNGKITLVFEALA